MDDTESNGLLRDISRKVDKMALQVAVIPMIREDVGEIREHQRVSNGRLLLVERDTLIARGGLIVLAFVVTVGIASAAVWATLAAA